MLLDVIKSFPKQFEYEPKIENGPIPNGHRQTVIAGMGGSLLAAKIIKSLIPKSHIILHNEYGLPIIERFEETLFIASSYSGNTEETIDGFREARKRKIASVVIATGGELLKEAQASKTPFIELPKTGIQPRHALGYSFKALLAALGEKDALDDATRLAGTLKPETHEEEGKALALKLKNSVPIIYASARNFPIAYNWKIKFNETAKIPAFCNELPELNHNEMNGFDWNEQAKALSRPFHFIFLRDEYDHPRIQRRMEVLQSALEKRSLSVSVTTFSGSTTLQRIFSSIILADWVSYFTSQIYGTDPEQVPMVEEFKRNL